MPATRPMMMGRANSLMESTPSTYSAPMVSSVVMEVLMERVMLSLILLLTISSRPVSLRLPSSLVFSRTLSNTTMVLLME